ncbi:MAG TPA: DNA polymerase Y family protein [Firmicutes bacterium]|nr:DNA polymerase Y family protein [Bacillota bacterium]
MDRWACVNIPALPLQFALVQRPDWKAYPVVIISRDAPNGEVMWLNKKAARSGIRKGLRYATALEIEPDLRANVISRTTISRQIKRIENTLQTVTPDVESSDDIPGVFWLNATGMGGVYGTISRWGKRIIAILKECGYQATVTIGFTRFGTYAASAAHTGVTIFRDRAEELQTVHEIKLRDLSLPSDLVDTLGMLGIETVDGFIALPADGLRKRFGETAYTLHRWASGDMWDPLRPERREPTLYSRIEFERPESDALRLFTAISSVLQPLIHQTSARGNAVREVRWVMLLDTGERRSESVKPATPSIDERQIGDLVRLRIESLQLDAGVDELLISVQTVPTQAGQTSLLTVRQKRDLAAADRALARLRAEFGDNAVVRACLEDRQLPEARYRWEPVDRARFPKPVQTSLLSLVRRVYTKPRPIQQACMVTKIAGPYVVSGGWWYTTPESKEEVHREYYFVLTTNEAILWVYYDRANQQWFAQGEVA